MIAITTAAVLLARVTTSAADIVNLEFAAWSARGSDDDLLRFVTRPDLTPPKWEVSFHDRDESAPGYIFVAPYDCLECSHRPTTTYVTQQIGPHIYTQDGVSYFVPGLLSPQLTCVALKELVWSGIDLFPDRKVFDFRPVMIDDAHHLALVTPHDEEWHVFSDGAAIVLNASYAPVETLTSTDLGNKIDLHEFNVLDSGQSALVATKEVRDTTSADNIEWSGKVMECFFMDVDLRTQAQRFYWTASDHVGLNESTNLPPNEKPGEKQKHWDWFHLNSIDKDDDGNYLVSARATDTIYLVSKDGPILWRLGGVNSSFHQDFNFSRQHNARIRRQTKAHMIISFFDNAADDSGNWQPTSPSSSLLIVDLDVVAMTATLNHRHPRPDGGYSQAKGNVQYLPNGNILGGWGENAYVTEYSKPGGKVVYEASFATTRFANYRTYKMDFVAQPTSIPVTKAFASANSRGDLMTTIYVSWNGATEVVQWRYYSHTAKRGLESVVHIGNAYKTGFETTFVAADYHPIIFAEAVDAFGNSLANSSLEITELPPGFHDAEDPLLSAVPKSRSGIKAESELIPCAFLAGIVFTIFFNRFQNGRKSFVRQPALFRSAQKGR